MTGRPAGPRGRLPRPKWLEDFDYAANPHVPAALIHTLVMGTRAAVLPGRRLGHRNVLPVDRAGHRCCGSAGSNTAVGHLVLLDAAITALPPGFRRRLMITCDGAGPAKA